jgi:hypothetical protein
LCLQMVGNILRMKAAFRQAASFGRLEANNR